MQRPGYQSNEPAQEPDWRHDADDDEPEPDDGEDLLVEQVDRQDALDRVSVHVRVLPDPEVAHGNPRKPIRSFPFVAHQQMAYDVDSEDVEVVTEEDVEQEELSDRVGRVQDLDEEVAERQIVAVQLAVREDAMFGQRLAYPRHAPVR